MATSHSRERRSAILAARPWRLIVLVAILLLGLAQPLSAAAAQAPINLRAPAQPVHVHATAVDGAALLSWVAPYDDGSPITGYTITAYSPDTNGVVVAARTVPADATSLRWMGVDGPFLRPGVAYVFTVSATNAVGDGLPSKASNSIIWVPGITAPAQVQNVRAAAANGAATLTWDAPDNGGSPITGYEVAIYRSGQNVVDWKMLPGNSTTTTLDWLDNGVTYTFTVQALNASGWGSMSDPSNAVVPERGTPDAPANVQATAGNSSATISWFAPYDGGSPITGYMVRAYLGWTANVAATREVLGNATSVTMMGIDHPLLVNGTTYTFAVQARNANGWGPESARSNPVTPGPTAPPDAPTNVQATAGIGSAVVSWASGASDGGSPITGYLVTAYQGGTTNVVTTVTADRNARSAFLNLPSGGTYTFVVQAGNAVGQGPQSTRSNAITLPAVPDAPRNLTANADESSAHLSWDAPASDGGMPIESYRISASDGVHDPITATTTGTSITISGLTNGVTYTVSVVAVNKVGQGSPASISVTTRNLPPALKLPGDQSASYGDEVTFEISASDAEAGDHITLSASGLPAGLSFSDRGDGFGSVSGTAQVPAGDYPITFSASDGHNPAVTQTLTLTVTAKAAVVTLSRTNPAVITVPRAGAKARSVTLRAAIAEPGTNSYGDISKVGSVIYRLTGLVSGATRTCIASRSGGGVGGTLQTACRFGKLAVGAYRVEIEASSGYYEAATEATLMVDYPARSSVWGQGAVDRDEGQASVSFRASFDRHSRLIGQLTYVEHRAEGDIRLGSIRVDGLVIKGNTAYITGRARLNGRGSYRFLATVDRSDGEQFGLWVGDAASGPLSDLTFEPLDLTSGQIGMRG